MKRVLSTFLAAVMTLTFAGCGSSKKDSTETPKETPTAEPTAKPEFNTEEELVNDAWKELEALGKVETENGVSVTTITLPADLIEEGTTQESLDAAAGENYVSAVMNEDGSVTYKMTKEQHKAMLDSVVASMDGGLQDLVDSGDYAISKITHTGDFTSFDVTLDTEEVGFAESLISAGFYLYGGFYGLFAGHDAGNIEVKYYTPNGKLIETYNSKDLGTRIN